MPQFKQINFVKRRCPERPRGSFSLNLPIPLGHWPRPPWNRRPVRRPRGAGPESRRSLLSSGIIILLAVFLPAVLCLPAPVLAQDEAGSEAERPPIEISPAVIKETAQARDIFEYKVKITNNTQRKAELYAVVSDVTVDGGAQPPKGGDRTVSLSEWINISRGVIELDPGESVEKDLKIEVSTYALPGERYATISFPAAADRYAAQNKAGQGKFGNIFINYKIEENIVEKAQVLGFKSVKKVYLEMPAVFEVTLANFGNRGISPAGKIYISDRRGRLSGEAGVNSANEEILPEEEKSFTASWSPPSGFGKYKARLEMQYGQNGQSLMDTVYFWIIPWRFLAVFSGLVFILLVFLVLILFKRTYRQAPAEQGPGPRGVINLRKIK